MADGGMPERPNGAVSKTAVPRKGHRGFKSHFLRHSKGHHMYRSNRGTRARGRTVLSALAVVVLGVVVASPVGAAPAKVLQKAGVLRLTDFPADWKAEKSTSDAPPKLAGCAAIAKVGKTLRKTSTKSPDFTTGTLTRAHNSVVVVASPKVATTDFKPYEGNALTDCFKPAAEKAFRDPSIDSLVVTTPPSGLTAPGADQSVSTEIVIAATIAATASQPANEP